MTLEVIVYVSDTILVLEVCLSGRGGKGSVMHYTANL